MSPTFQDLEGNTPLHYAVCRKEKGCSAKDRNRVALLLEHSADVNAANKNGSTALHLTSDAEIARMLLEAGADPNVADAAGGSTPLHVAARGRHKDIARLMLRRGGDATRPNASGKTPLNLAKDKEMRRILLGKDDSDGSPAPSPSMVVAASTRRKKAPEDPCSSSRLAELASVVAPACTSPGILKKRRRPSSSGGDRTSAGETTEDDSSQSPTAAGASASSKRCRRSEGPRLRFSDVNDYSGVEVVEEVRRVKAMPIYSEPNFSSDDEDDSAEEETA